MERKKRTKVTREMLAAAEKVLEKGGGYKAAAEAAGLSVSTIHKWLPGYQDRR